MRAAVASGPCRICLEAEASPAADNCGVTTVTVYVELLDEGVDVWRPVEAERESDGVVRLPGNAPDGETWAYPPGSRVRCERRDIGLVAVALAG
jgi:hypothetical protein